MHCIQEKIWETNLYDLNLYLRFNTRSIGNISMQKIAELSENIDETT